MSVVEARVITNVAICTGCGFSAGVVLEGGIPVCKHCGSSYLLGTDMRPFVPVFADNPARVFRASRYTPEVRCRRGKGGPWPKIRERRRGVVCREVMG